FRSQSVLVRLYKETPPNTLSVKTPSERRSPNPRGQRLPCSPQAPPLPKHSQRCHLPSACQACLPGAFESNRDCSLHCAHNLSSLPLNDLNHKIDDTRIGQPQDRGGWWLSIPCAVTSYRKLARL